MDLDPNEPWAGQGIFDIRLLHEGMRFAIRLSYKLVPRQAIYQLGSFVKGAANGIYLADNYMFQRRVHIFNEQIIYVSIGLAAEPCAANDLFNELRKIRYVGTS